MDLVLFTECVRHSPLSHRLVQNMCGPVRTIDGENVRRDGHANGQDGRQGHRQNDGEDDCEVEGQDGEEGKHSAFAAQADLLCVVLRADTSRQQQTTSSSPSTASPLSLPFSTSLSSAQCFTDALLAGYPQAPSHLLAALSDTLISLTHMLNTSLAPGEYRQHSSQVDTHSSPSAATHYPTFSIQLIQH
jgi:hypothetical protein